MTPRKAIVLIITVLLVNRIDAQTKQVTHQSLYWMRYYNQLNLNEKWVWHNEIDERRFFVNQHHQHVIMHTRFHYKFHKNTDAAFGFTYSLQGQQDPNSRSHFAVPELRPVQEINYINPISERWSIQHRIRIEERFFQKNNGKELQEGYDFNFRFRYKLQANFKLHKNENKKAATLKMAEEIMINAGKNIVYNTFDQNRIYIAIEQVLHKNFSIEIGYLYWYQKRPTKYQYYERDIVRLTLYHKIKV